MVSNIHDIAACEGHNSGDMTPEQRAQRIREHAASLEPHEEKIRSENAAIKKLNNAFKSETGITLADFRAARRFAEMEDEGQMEKKADDFQACFNALSPAKQLTFFEEDRNEAA